MEYQEGTLNFDPISITEDEREYASNSYLMSLFAFLAGLPLPIFNLIATIIFYYGKRKSTKFVKWHCTQALVSQLFIFFFNTVGFWWTVSIIFQSRELNNYYFGYITLILIINIIEIISTIYTAVKTRAGKHVRWYLFGDLTDEIVK